MKNKKQKIKSLLESEYGGNVDTAVADISTMAVSVMRNLITLDSLSDTLSNDGLEVTRQIESSIDQASRYLLGVHKELKRIQKELDKII